MKFIKNISLRQTFSNFYINLSICLIILTISCWSLFYFDTYPIAQSESGIFFYPSYIFTQNLKNWSEFYLGARNSIHQSYQTFIYRFLITPDIDINPFYIQFSYYLIMFYLGFLGFYKSISLYSNSNKLLNLYTSLVYIFNPVSGFFLLRFQYPYITFYYLFPLIFYLTHKSINSTSTKNFFKYMFFNFLLLALFSIIYAAMPTLFLLFLFWMFYSLVLVIGNSLKSLKIDYFIIFKRLLPFFAIWFLINMYWFVPFLIELGNPNTLVPVKEVLNKNENVNTFTFFSNRDSDMLSIVALLTKEFLVFLNHRYLVQIIIYSFATIPFLIILINLFEIFKKKNLYLKKFNVNLFIILSLILIFFIFLRGDNEPFGKFLKYLFINVPIFQVLRNPFEKISLIYTFFFALVFSLSFINLFNRYKSLRYFLGIVFISYIFVVSHKMFNGKLLLGPFPPFNTPKSGFKLNVPDSYKFISKEINIRKQNVGISRTLVVPTVQEGITYNWDKGYIGVDFIENFISNDAYSFVSPDTYDDRKKLILNLPTAKDKSGLLQIFGFKNLIFRNDFDYLSREINDPITIKINMLNIPDDSSYNTIPLSSLHLIFSEEKYIQTNYGRIINTNPPYTIPLDWTRNVYIRANLPSNFTIPNKLTYKFSVKLSNDDNIRDINEFKANSSRRRVSSDEIQKDISLCSTCYSTNFITTEDTRPSNSFEFLMRLSTPAQFINIDDMYISYYKNNKLNNEISLINEYPQDNLSYYTLDRTLPIFLSPKNILEIPNYTYLLNYDLDPLNTAYFIIDKDSKNKTFPEDIEIRESSISFKKISNSEYDIEILPKDKIDGNYNTLLTFNFSADSLWKIVKLDTQLKFTNNDFLFEENQYVTNSYANTWLLKDIPSQGLKLKLIYTPKIYFNLFYQLSVLFSALFTLYLLYLVLKDYFNARYSK